MEGGPLGISRALLVPRRTARTASRVPGLLPRDVRVPHAHLLPLHLSLIAPSSVSNSVKDGGHSVDLSFLLFHQLSHMKVKVAPVINDKKHPKHLVVTGALHVIQ